jgi:hypothetical protein
MENYNVTKNADKALLNKQRSSMRSGSQNTLQNQPRVRSNSTVLLEPKTSKWDEIGANKTVRGLKCEKRARAKKPNVTLVYQGDIVAKFANLTRESAVMRRA